MKSLKHLLKAILNENDYRCSFVFDLPAERVFESLTLNIPEWWSTHFEGDSNQVNKIFTVRFGTTFKTIEVIELIPYRKLVWEVKSSFIDIPELTNKSEWVGTRIYWEIFEEEEVRSLMLTHKGLNPNLECFGICENGWKDYTESLSNYLDTGRGQPYRDGQEVSGA